MPGWWLAPAAVRVWWGAPVIVATVVIVAAITVAANAAACVAALALAQLARASTTGLARFATAALSRFATRAATATRAGRPAAVIPSDGPSSVMSLYVQFSFCLHRWSKT